MVAARLYQTDADRIEIELDENVDKQDRKTVIINFNESMKAEPAIRAAVERAVAAVLPDEYKDRRVLAV